MRLYTNFTAIWSFIYILRCQKRKQFIVHSSTQWQYIFKLSHYGFYYCPIYHIRDNYYSSSTTVISLSYHKTFISLFQFHFLQSKFAKWTIMVYTVLIKYTFLDPNLIITNSISIHTQKILITKIQVNKFHQITFSLSVTQAQLNHLHFKKAN